jgi:hypothetical protein
MPIEGLGGLAEELTLSLDPSSGEYTRLTRFLAGAEPRRLAVNYIPTRKRCLLSVDAYTIMHLTYGFGLLH